MKRRKAALLSGVVLMMGMAITAHALSLGVELNGGSMITVVDNAALDSSSNTGDIKGVITYNSQLGLLTVTDGGTGFSKSLSGLNENGAGAITSIKLFLNDGTSPNAIATMVINGNPSNVNIFKSSFDITNTILKEGTPTVTTGKSVSAGSGVTVSAVSGVTNSADYGVTVTEIIASNPPSVTEGMGSTSTEYSSVSTPDAVVLTPEPGTMVLLGIGMLGLAIYGKRRMKKEAK